MGSITSGNHGGRPTVEDGLTLNLAKLLRDGLFRPGQSWGGFPHLDEYTHRRAHRLNRLSGSPRRGWRPGASALHHDALDRREAQLGLLG
jgi:hypothetical protein